MHDVKAKPHAMIFFFGIVMKRLIVGVKAIGMNFNFIQPSTAGDLSSSWSSLSGCCLVRQVPDAPAILGLVAAPSVAEELTNLVHPALGSRRLFGGVLLRQCAFAVAIYLARFCYLYRTCIYICEFFRAEGIVIYAVIDDNIIINVFGTFFNGEFVAFQ